MPWWIWILLILAGANSLYWSSKVNRREMRDLKAVLSTLYGKSGTVWEEMKKGRL